MLHSWLSSSTVTIIPTLRRRTPRHKRLSDPPSRRTAPRGRTPGWNWVLRCHTGPGTVSHPRQGSFDRPCGATEDSGRRQHAAELAPSALGLHSEGCTERLGSTGLALRKDVGVSCKDHADSLLQRPLLHGSDGDVEAQRELMTCTKSGSKMAAAGIRVQVSFPRSLLFSY